MEPRPPCFLRVAGLDTAAGEFRRNGRDDGRVEPAGEQNAVRHVAHHLAFDGSFKRVAQAGDGRFVVFHVVEFEPVALIPAGRLRVAAAQIAARLEFLQRAADAFEGLQFGGDVVVAVVVPSFIQRDDADGIAADEKHVLLRVIEGEGEDALQLVEKIRAIFNIKRQKHFAVGLSLELITAFQFAPQLLVVVDFAVDGQNVASVRAVERLLA